MRVFALEALGTEPTEQRREIPVIVLWLAKPPASVPPRSAYCLTG
jgi:hypothetical protein